MKCQLEKSHEELDKIARNNDTKSKEHMKQLADIRNVTVRNKVLV